MRAFISEDDIEQALCARLAQPDYGWTRIECDPSVDKQDVINRTEELKKYCVKRWWADVPEGQLADVISDETENDEI